MKHIENKLDNISRKSCFVFGILKEKKSVRVCCISISVSFFHPVLCPFFYRESDLGWFAHTVRKWKYVKFKYIRFADQRGYRCKRGKQVCSIDFPFAMNLIPFFIIIFSHVYCICMWFFLFAINQPWDKDLICDLYGK